jgi:hypothetical protein
MRPPRALPAAHFDRNESYAYSPFQCPLNPVTIFSLFLLELPKKDKWPLVGSHKNQLRTGCVFSVEGSECPASAAPCIFRS